MFFTQGSQEQGRQFVAQGVLQAAKPAGKGLHPFGQIGVSFEMRGLLHGEQIPEEASGSVMARCRYSLRTTLARN